MDITIACVLKTGDFYNRNMKVNYDVKYPLWLKRQCEKFVTIPHKLVCLTDLPKIDGVETIKLKHNFPGWWSKMELFRPDIFSTKKIFYIDLDTVIVGNVDNILSYNHKFSVLRNMSTKDKQSKKIGSGIMAWSKDLSFLYHKFLEKPEAYMKEYTTSDKWGDQGFISQHCQGMERFQTLFPEQLVSWKFDLLKQDPTPNNKIVVFHGEPKPHQVTKKWIPQL